MNRIYPDSKGNLRHGNIEIFLEIVVDNYINAIRNKKETEQSLKEFKKRHSNEDLNDLNNDQEKELQNIFKKSDLTNKLTIQSIIMFVSFFEGLINEIGSIELGQKYFQNHLDKLSILSKWEIILKLIYGENLNRESQYYENLKNLISTRNGLIHYKTKKITDNSIEAIADQMQQTPDYFLILEKNLQTFETFFEELRRIDSEKKILSLYNISSEIERYKTCT